MTARKRKGRVAEAVNVGQDGGGGAQWVDDGGGGGCALVFVSNLATGLPCTRHDSAHGKDRLSHTQKKKERLEPGADCTVTNGEKRKRNEANAFWSDPTQANIVNYSA